MKRNGGCLKWIGYVFIAILFFCALAQFGKDDSENGKEENIELQTETANEESNETDLEEISVKKQKIYSKKKVTITVTGYDNSNNSLKLNINNKSDLNLNFCAHAYAINGIMTNNNIYDIGCDVAKGKKANTELEIDSDFLKTSGITQIKYFDILFWAYDNDKSYKSFETDIIRIETDKFDGNTKYFSGENIYSKDKIKVDYLGCSGDEYKFSVKNSTGDYLAASIRNLSINNFTLSDEDFYLSDVYIFNKCQSILTISANEEFLEKNEIDKINKIEFSLNIRPKDDYFNTWDTDVMKIKIK